MKYLCLVYADPNPDGPPDPGGDTIKDACIELDNALFEAGKLDVASPLQGPETAAVIRFRNGVAVRTDGPFMETKEWIAGFMVIEAKDMDEAITIATEGPPVGTLELRPLLEERHSRTGQDRSALFARRR